MNLTKFGLSSWIIILNIFLLLILITQLTISYKEYYVNYPEQIDPTKPIITNSDAITANNNYASILMFLQKNPSKSDKFISDVKDKFFTDSCTIKDNIDFTTLAKMPYGMPF